VIREPHVDVVTIGAGLTAAMLANEIANRTNLRVLSLEQGRNQWTFPDFAHNHDEIEGQIKKAMMVDLRRETFTWRPAPDRPALPMRRYGTMHPGQGLGGAAVHWSAMHWRFLPIDFRFRSHHVERYGEEMLPENTTIQDWPVSYDELEPYYDRFEYELGISGVAGNIRGQILEGGNIFEGPRSRDFPLPPLERSIPAYMFEETTRGMGYHPFPQPAAILSRGWTDPFGQTRSGCLYCGFCTRYGCEVDAKASPITTYFRPALETGRYDVRTGAKVLHINTAPDGLATGVTWVDRDGREHEQPADIVIVSGFVLENNRILMLSRSGAHPEGIGNDRGMLGRNYTYQIWKSPSSGVWEDRRFNLFMGNSATLSVLYDFNSDLFDHSGLGFIGGASIFAGLGERGPLSAIEGLPEAGDLAVERGWGADWKRDAVRHWDSWFPITIQGDSIAYRDHVLDLDPNYRDAFGRPLIRITFDWTQNEYRLYEFLAARAIEIMREMGPDHIEELPELEPYEIDSYQSTHPNGGCIMGTDPGNSVTNKYGQVWDTPNVFVTGASLFPQNPGSNPTGTVGALAHLAADGIIERYLGGNQEEVIA
jgi:gluconate 2-dehydrogenase alpha chain